MMGGIVLWRDDLKKSFVGVYIYSRTGRRFSIERRLSRRNLSLTEVKVEIYCRRCGASNAAGNVSCSSCGTSLKVTVPLPGESATVSHLAQLAHLLPGQLFQNRYPFIACTGKRFFRWRGRQMGSISPRRAPIALFMSGRPSDFCCFCWRLQYDTGCHVFPCILPVSRYIPYCVPRDGTRSNAKHEIRFYYSWW